MNKRKKMIVLGILFIAVIIMGIYRLVTLDKGYAKDKIACKEVENELEAATGVRIELNDRYLTYGNVEEILERLHLKEYITYEDQTASKRITREAWHSIYSVILDYFDTEHNVQVKELLVLGADNKKDVFYTSGGTFATQGVSLDIYTKYKCYVMDKKLLGIIKQDANEAVLENVYLESLEDEKAKILFDRREYVFSVKGSNEKLNDVVCDMVFDGKTVREIRKKQETVSGNLVTLDENEIEIEGYGKLPLAERVPAYKLYGTLEEKSLTDIVIGNMKVEYVVGKGMVQAVLLKEPANIQNIRVLLLNGESPYYENICVTSDKDFYTQIGDTKRNHKAGEIIQALGRLESMESSCKISTKDGGKIYRTNEKGAYISLGYTGSIEIRKKQNGYTVVNEVNFEDYICGVLPSEMPEKFDSEALKAQAVCARSYAYMQLMKGDYAALGAHVDDSTNYQVYNKNEAGNKSILAVKDTSGQVLKYQGNVIEAFYYSTSCGHTGTMEDWNQKNDKTYGYLQNIWVREEQKKENLSQEQKFRKYITTGDGECFDGNISYFRWNASLDFNGKDETVRNILTAAKQSNSKNIMFYQQDKKKKSLKGFGAVTEVSVKERSDSGAILVLKVQFENGTALVKNEYNIRKVLGAAVEEITYQDGTKKSDLIVLPSAYCVVDYSVEKKKAMTYGGGYGHGIGMSQYGADGMAKQGYTYDEILKFFYQDIEIEGIY